MKKLLLFLTLIVLGTMSIRAEGGGFHVGAHFNYHVTAIINAPNDDSFATKKSLGKQVNNPYGNFENKFGYFIGLPIGYDFNDVIGIQTEVNISKQGGAFKSSDGKHQKEINLGYIQLPLLFKLTSGGDKSKFYMLIGAQYSILRTAETKFITDGNNTDKLLANTTERLDQYKKDYIINLKTNNQVMKSDIGLVLGLGADIKLTDLFYLNAGLRLYYGISDLNQEAFRKDSERAVYAASNNVFGGLNLGISYKFLQK